MHDFWRKDFWRSDFWRKDFWRKDFWQKDFWQTIGKRRKASPSLFSQLWVIHGIYNQKCYPFVFALLPNKETRTYLNVLNNLPDDLKPETVIIDYEKSEHNALVQKFPNVKIQGCFFHYAQAVIKQSRINGLGSIDVISQPGFMRHLKMFISLAFVEEDDVPRYFNELAAAFASKYGEQETANFIHYFKNNWVGSTYLSGNYKCS